MQFIYAQKQRDDNWIVRYNRASVEQAFDVTLESDGFTIESIRDIEEYSYVYCHLRLERPNNAISFNYQSIVNPAFIPKDMVIKLSTSESYGGPWRGGITGAVNISLNNETDAKVILLPGTVASEVRA